MPVAHHASVFLATVILMAAPAATSAENVELNLWPARPPGETGQLDAARVRADRGENTIERITYVADPTITLYRPAAETANGCGVIICPGGGYNILAWKKEGLEVAEWLNSLGVTSIVLKYRVPRRNNDAPYRAPLQDAQRAVRLVRRHAGEWGIDPGRVGMLGFSAGGNLTVMAGIKWDETTYARVDGADDLSCRPDFLIPIYPAYLGGSEDEVSLSPLVRVTGRTPPTFIAVTYDDRARGAHAALLFAELKRAAVPAELHVFSKGGHGYGLRPSENPVSSWPKLCADWLRVSGLLEVAKD